MSRADRAQLASLALLAFVLVFFVGRCSVDPQPAGWHCAASHGSVDCISTN